MLAREFGVVVEGGNMVGCSVPKVAETQFPKQKG